MKNAALRVCGSIFLIVAALHLVRLIYKVEITAAGHVIPLWMSAAGFPAALGLAGWSFYASAKK